MADVLRALLDERGWSNSHLAVLLAERTGKTKRGALRQVQQWLNGAAPTDENIDALAAVFDVDAAVFRRSQMSEAEEADLRRIAARAAAEAAELRRLVADLQKKQRRTQELPKPGSERQTGG